VPVYNTKRYLHECVNSVLLQTFTEYELILINDGSTDGSEDICDRLAAKNAKITVIHKENGGLSDARNAGLDKASGDYIWFLDSDDFLLIPNALDLVFQNIKSQNSDCCVFSYQKYWQDAGRYGTPFFTDTKPDTDILQAIASGFYKAMACNKVVKHDLITSHHMCFPKDKLGEDLEWCASLLYYSKNISFCDKNIIAYRQRNGSITKKTDLTFKIKHRKDTFSLLNESISKFPKKYKDGLIYHYLACEYVFWLTDAYDHWDTLKSEARKIAFLLDFSLSKKVYLANIVYRVLGLYITSLLLNFYKKLKNWRR
jgi:glycosyltransferase involved in cell wall biosynthesis